MSGPTPPEPVEALLAERLAARGDPRLSRVVRLLRSLDTADRNAYRAVAELHTPWLDEPLRRASDFANFSKPWLLVAGALAAFGGERGRRAALTGVAAIGVTSLLVNQPMKLAARRRPRRSQLGVPETRWVRYAVIRLVPFRALRVGGGILRRDQRGGARAALATTSGCGGRGVLARVHRGALPRRRPGRCFRRCRTRTRVLDRGLAAGPPMTAAPGAGTIVTGSGPRATLHARSALHRDPGRGPCHLLRTDPRRRVDDVRGEQADADSEGVAGNNLGERVHPEHEPIEPDDERHQHTDHQDEAATCALAEEQGRQDARGR